MIVDTNIGLDDKYVRADGQIFLTGMQALVRLALEQRRVDIEAGHRTAGFISGYRGSPIGGFDRELWRAQKHLDRHDIRFQPGVNEDIAATSVWGSQQAPGFQGARYDGVFAMWYGKGPGLDRSGDAIRHANQAGTSPLGGVLAIVGDDHAAKSSAFGAQSEYAFMDWMMPVLAPSSVAEFIDLGLFGFALSRFSGLWVGYKIAGVSADSSATVHLPQRRAPFLRPQVALPPGGLHLRYPEPDRAAYEAKLKAFRIPAAIAFARANGVNRRVLDAARPCLGILTAGKAHGDVARALTDLGIGPREADALGLRVHKLGMTWPLVPDEICDFAKGLETVLVVEEKRGFVEEQVKAILYDAGLARPPRIIGKRDESGESLLSDSRELDSLAVASALLPRLSAGEALPALQERLASMKALAAPAPADVVLARTPYFCSGCPHNRSTVLPEGSIAIGGIGCHTLATRMDRGIRAITHMGGEGASWIGIAPFVDTPHVFQNVGDGTYFHSAQLCVRAAVAAGVSMTFKILYNDAIAMTGGQPLDGTMTVQQLASQVAAEGVARIAVVADDPDKYGGRNGFPPQVSIDHRDGLARIQDELKAVGGVSVLIYDQTCAAEKRRRRKRDEYPDPPIRVVINEAVCEGCGDCGVKSNCLSVTPVETEFGTKRRIDQTSCNKDYSCVDGFCPSFVTVEGGRLRKGKARPSLGGDLPAPALPALDEPYALLLAGIGGTGIVTVGAILGMAAHAQGLACTVNDVTGSAQKGGLVASHIIFADAKEKLAGERIGAGAAHAMIAADMVVAAMPEILSRVGARTRYALVSTDPVQTGSFVGKVDQRFPDRELRQRLVERLATQPDFLAAATAANALTGNTTGANILMLGIAWQKGAIPLSLEAIHHAIRLNGVAVEASLAAFDWGRRIGSDPAIAGEIGAEAQGTAIAGLDDLVEHRARLLADYQNEAYAARYRGLVARARAAEDALGVEGNRFAEAVARQACRLMAYKDEYEVARLLSSATFGAAIARQFEGEYTVRFHMAPPLLARRDERTGHLRKRAFGPWMRGAMAVLAKFRFLRGTPADPFGYAAERREERALMRDYVERIEALCGRLGDVDHETAVELAGLPDIVRGFGHVKERNIARYRAALSDAQQRLHTAESHTPEPVH